jgi:alkylation response protein AidB-like acyl-CoA dehydrogenase
MAALLRGGEWLLEATSPDCVFTPERRTDEHRLIGRTTRDFVSAEVLPELGRLEQKDWGLARRLLGRCGDLGLLGVDVPEEYGGLDLDKVTSVIVSEELSGAASFGATFGAQANLVILPLTLFGTDDQKRRYLPGLLTAELVGAYCLSESGSGSDALGAHTRATRQADGSFVLSGEKMWITNGGFADLFIVFARVVDTGPGQFTAFLVERAFPGVSSGTEEHKMGLHGSSTTAVVLQDVRVPAANVLGEIGKGHKVAFNVLNFGRFKLGAMCSGGIQGAVGEAARYAATRRQFGRPIASFGAIKAKIGEMIVRGYGVESALYRTAGMIDARIGSGSHDGGPVSALDAFEQYAIEASIAKVSCSEALDFALDENIQIHGGNGYVADYPAERHYRDARVNRIFEGTNEINRLLIPGLMARRAAKGELPVIARAKALQDELMGAPAAPIADTTPLADARRAVDAFRKTALLVLGVAMQTYREELTDQQEVLMHASDILMDIYTADSAALRASAAAGSATSGFHEDAARVFVNDAAMRIEASARQALATMAEGDGLRIYLAGVRRLLKVTPVNTTELRRRLADRAVACGGYIF